MSSPAFESGGAPGLYVPSPFDAPHPDFDLRNMFPIERTYSEWQQSEYAAGGVFAPLPTSWGPQPTADRLRLGRVGVAITSPTP